MNAITDFINNELYPVLFYHVDKAFPELQFTKSKNGHGKDWNSPLTLKGTEPTSGRREDKTVVTAKKPHLIHEQGGETYSLVSYQLLRTGHYPGAQGKELVEAVRYLASLCGLELPDCETEEYKAYKERQEKLENTMERMKQALRSPEGAETLRYLTEERKYTLEEIDAMELGYCSPGIAKTLEDAPYGAGDTYKLAIGYRSRGRLLGYKLRALEDIKPKYKNSVGLPKSSSFFGLSGLKLTGNKEKDRDLIIVEGELDALHAQALGVENIASSTGVDGINTEALLEAKKQGVKRITVVVDWEKTEADRKKKTPIVERAIHTIHKAGLESLIIELPGTDGEKTDVDSYLLSNSKDELLALIDEAESGALYIWNKMIRGKAIELSGGEGERITDKVLQDYKRETLELLKDTEVVSPTERDRILSYFSRSVGEDIGKEALQEEADRQAERANQERQKKQGAELIKQASQLAETDINGALQLVLDRGREVLNISRETEYASLLALPDREGIRRKLSARPKGISTDYIFSKGRIKERLTLPTGAVTLLCAPPAHGKSTLLRNLALQTANNGDEGTVLYFTMEEDYESTIIELVNTYVGEELTTPYKEFNNLTTLAEYYRTDDTRYIKKSVLATFKEKEAQFMENLIQSGKLRIYDGDYYSDELLEAIRYICGKVQVKAVFIDYVQLLYKRGNKLARNEELKEIAKSLRQLAKEKKLPIVLAGQLNRQAKSPTEMHSQNIADSADLEREANKVILLWNSEYKPLNDSGYNETEIAQDKRPILGTPGAIYARLSKNRGGAPNLDVLLKFVGNTGVIETNSEDFTDEDEPTSEAEQRELF